MKQLPVDLTELVDAFENGDEEIYSFFFDLETGQMVMVASEIREMAEELAVQLGGREATDSELQEAESDLPEWQRGALAEALAIELGYGDRYVRIERQPSYEAYGVMEDFIATVRDARLQVQLADAIRGRGAFGRFGAVLRGYPSERQRWFDFRDERMRRRALEWLEGHDIEPITPAQAAE